MTDKSDKLRGYLRDAEEEEYDDEMDPDALDLFKELRGQSNHNQAITLMEVRKTDPKLVLRVIRLLKARRRI